MKLKFLLSIVTFLVSGIAFSNSDQPMTGLFLGGFPGGTGAKAMVNQLKVDGLVGYKSYTCYANDLKGQLVAQQVSIAENVAEARKEFFKAHLASGVKFDTKSKSLYIKIEFRAEPVVIKNVICNESSEEDIVEKFNDDSPY